MSAKILVVDDNPTNLKLVSDVLKFEGYDIFKAVDAEEAQVVLAATLADLILMDIALPGMDGLTLTRKLKAEERTRGIRIVALTAFAMKGDDQKAFDAGCDGYITKPIDTRKLPDQVALFLARASGQSRRSRIQILIIEDSAVDLKLADLVLSTAGYDVSTAEAADQAFAAIREGRPQLILIDLDLPGMDGLAIARKLKGDPDTRAIHIVAVTCYPEQYPKATALAAGCDAYLLKPINTRKLSDQLNAVAEGSDAVNWQAKERAHGPPHR
jgi:two-component system cell cycle response regulator